MRAESAVLEAYGEAMARVVRPGMVVLDLGGDAGRRAVRACRLGAARVFLVAGPMARSVAMRLARANACADRLRCIADVSELPSDALVDLVFAAMSADPVAIQTAEFVPLREMAPLVLARGATLPVRESIRAAVVRADRTFARHVGVWERTAKRTGIGLTSIARRVVHGVAAVRDEPPLLLTLPCERVVWDGREHAAESGLEPWVLTGTLSAPNIGHGIGIWSGLDLGPGHTLGGPEGPASDLGWTFLPWPEPVTLDAGSTVRVTVRLDGRLEAPVWSWSSVVDVSGVERCRFRQSTFLAGTASPAQVAHAGLSDCPRLSDAGLLHMERLSGLRDGQDTGGQ